MIRPMLIAALVSAPFAANAQSGPPKLVHFYSTFTGYPSTQAERPGNLPNNPDYVKFRIGPNCTTIDGDCQELQNGGTATLPIGETINVFAYVDDSLIVQGTTIDRIQSQGQPWSVAEQGDPDHVFVFRSSNPVGFHDPEKVVRSRTRAGSGQDFAIPGTPLSLVGTASDTSRGVRKSDAVEGSFRFEDDGSGTTTFALQFFVDAVFRYRIQFEEYPKYRFDASISVQMAEREVSFRAASANVNEGDMVAIPVALNTASSERITVAYRTENATAVAGEDFVAASGTLTFEPGETEKEIIIRIEDDVSDEAPETFSVVLQGPQNAELGSTPRQTVTIADDDDPSQASLASPDEAREVDEIFVGSVRLDKPSGVEVTVRVATQGQDGQTAAGTDSLEPGDEPGEAPDYTSIDETLTFAPGIVEREFRIPIVNDDLEEEGGEYFQIVMTQQLSQTETRTNFANITILDGPDPVLAAMSAHLLSRSDALLDGQPRLAGLMRNSAGDDGGFDLRVSSAGADALGGFRSEGFWGSAAYARVEVGDDADADQFLTSLGAHARLSDGLFLGGMLQHDRSGTTLDGELGFGKITGNGWMAGPYFVARDASSSLLFEGRLLYGRSSNDVEGFRAKRSLAPGDGTFDSERWLALARVEGEYRFANGAVMFPLASLGHVGSAADGFDYDDGSKRDPEDPVRTSVTKLHLGTDFEIPVESSDGDLILRPGLGYVLSDRDGGEFGRSERSSAARVDFGVDYMLEYGVSLGFRSYYSGLGGSELESFGASLDVRMRF